MDYCDCLIRPVITEKTMLGTSNGSYTFIVNVDANKNDIKQAVETIFNVKVGSVRVLNREGKSKTFKGKVGKRSNTRRAMVKLESGTINFDGGF